MSKNPAIAVFMAYYKS